jgi:hypothetical protein
LTSLEKRLDSISAEGFRHSHQLHMPSRSAKPGLCCRDALLDLDQARGRRTIHALWLSLLTLEWISGDGPVTKIPCKGKPRLCLRQASTRSFKDEHSERRTLQSARNGTQVAKDLG